MDHIKIINVDCSQNMRLVDPNFRSYNMEFLFINGTRELVDGHGALETIEKEVDIKELK